MSTIKSWTLFRFLILQGPGHEKVQMYTRHRLKNLTLSSRTLYLFMLILNWDKKSQKMYHDLQNYCYSLFFLSSDAHFLPILFALCEIPCIFRFLFHLTIGTEYVHNDFSSNQASYRWLYHSYTLFHTEHVLPFSQGTDALRHCLVAITACILVSYPYTLVAPAPANGAGIFIEFQCRNNIILTQ